MKRASIAVVALVLLAACSTSSVASRPSPSPSPTAVADYGAPPAGVPLVYIADPRHAGWYVGVDWTGKPRGTVKLVQPLVPPQTLVQAPDGSGFVIPGFKSQPGAGFLDRLGSPIAGSIAPTDRVLWADDSQHVCMLDGTFKPTDQQGKWRLPFTSPGSAGTAHAVALDSTTWSVGIIAIQLDACSARNDRAVLDYSYLDRPTDVYVARISDGAVLLHERHPANVLAGITASRDGSLVADNSSKSIGYLMGSPAPHTVVRRVADGSVVAQLDPGYFVVAFSSDDTLALVSTSPLASGAPTNMALVRLADGKVLWQRNSTEEYGGAWVSPDGADIAYQLGPPRGTAPGPIELVIVHPDGTAASFRLP